MFEEIMHENSSERSPGTIVQVNIPAGLSVNIGALLELSSPSGICLIVKSPLLEANNNFNLATVIESLKKAGITVEAIH